MGGLADTSTKGIAKGKGLLRRMARASGSGGHRFLVLPESATVDQHAAWVESGAVTDVVSASGETVRANGAHWGGDFLRRIHGVFVVRENDEEAVVAPHAPRPDVLIASPLGALAAHADYPAAKGDARAALRVVQEAVPQAFIEQLHVQFGGQDVILQPVAAIEQTGRNKLPLAGAEYLAHQVGLRTGLDIVQATKPKRTTMNGLERIFA